MNAAENILSSVRISQVYHALTGVEPRRTGRDAWRAPAAWRGGDGLNVSGDDSRGVWHDFVSDEGGGVLDLVVTVRGGSRRDALRWLAEYTGTPLQDKPLSPEDRAEYARRAREVERDLPTARLWKRAAVLMTEELLAVVKAGLFDPTQPQPGIGEIEATERMLRELRRCDGAELVREFHGWLDDHPGMTAALVDVARRRERAERRALLAYLGETAESVEAIA